MRLPVVPVVRRCGAAAWAQQYRGSSSQSWKQASSQVGETSLASGKSRKVVASGLSFGLNFQAPFQPTTHLSFSPVYTDVKDRYRFRTTIMVEHVDLGMVFTAGFGLHMVVMSGLPLVFDGLNPKDGGVSVVEGTQANCIFFTYTSLKLQTGAELVIYSVNCGIVFGDRKIVHGIVAPTGARKKWVNPILDTSGVGETIVYFAGYPLVALLSILSIFSMAGYWEMSSAVADDTEFGDDLTILLKEARKQQLLGNFATAAHVQQLIEEMVRLKQGDAKGAEEAKLLREKLEDPDSDRFRLFLGSTTDEPLYYTKDDEELLKAKNKKEEEADVPLPADVLIARAKEMEERFEKRRKMREEGAQSG